MEIVKIVCPNCRFEQDVLKGTSTAKCICCRKKIRAGESVAIAPSSSKPVKIVEAEMIEDEALPNDIDPGMDFKFPSG